MTSSEPPKYQGIAKDLQARLEQNEWSPGDRLPSQQLLAEHYCVTLMTLRQALQELEALGLVEAIKGKGTFVSEESVRYRLDHLSSFAQEMGRQGIVLTTEVMAINVAAPGRTPETDDFQDPSELLQLAPKQQLVEIVRRRSVPRRPIALQRSYLSVDNWDRIGKADLTNESLYECLSLKVDLKAERAAETLRAVRLNPRDAKLLDRKAGDAAMLSIRQSITNEGQVFLVDHALLPGDSTIIHAERRASGLQLSYQIGEQ